MSLPKIAVSLTLAALAFGGATFASSANHSAAHAAAPTISVRLVAEPIVAPTGCSRVFTAQQTVNYGTRIFAGTSTVSTAQRKHLAWMESCQRYQSSAAWVKHYDRLLAVRHHKRAVAFRTRAAEVDYAVASWYDDSGATASGFHAYYGVANRDLPFGTKVTFSYHGRSVTAVVDDRGPYVSPRDWDLNQNTMAALGFDGVDTVAYHIW